MTDSWALSGAVMPLPAWTIRAGGASPTNEDKSAALAATATQKAAREEEGAGVGRAAAAEEAIWAAERAGPGGWR